MNTLIPFIEDRKVEGSFAWLISEVRGEPKAVMNIEISNDWGGEDQVNWCQSVENGCNIVTCLGSPREVDLYTWSKLYYTLLIIVHWSQDMEYWSKYINQESVRRAIHVGNLTFHDGSEVETHLEEDIMKSVKPWIQEVSSIH